MTDFSIILYLCSWGPHPAYQTLQDTAADIPPEIKMVRIPCLGRITKALLFKPFELGVDGVALVGCEPGACRYGEGTDTAQRNEEDTRGILDLMGLNKDRLKLATFFPEDAEGLLRFLKKFVATIKKIGKTPVVPNRKMDLVTDNHGLINQVVEKYDIYACQDCGKCSSACSLTLAGKPFSPRTMANDIIAGNLDSDSVRKGIWSCLTCGLCYDRCPSAVNFPEFVRDMRCILRGAGLPVWDVHGGFLQSLMRTMTSKDLPIRHWDWLPEDIQLDDDSKTLFFGGCAPYFDMFFQKHLQVDTSSILVDGLRLLNFFDIHPRIFNDERCCGHDLIWSGDKDNFLRLARLNVNMIQDHGIEEVITTCPECYRTFSHDYPKQGVEVGFKVTHIFDFLEREIDKGAVGFKEFSQKITFQDPCRLSRFENRADLPRKLITRINPEALCEMKDRGSNAICCGNSAWIGCDSFSKALQVERLRQARDTGSDLMVTACPKCQIHLRCAMKDPFLKDELNMEIADLTSLLAKNIQWD